MITLSSKQKAYQYGIEAENYVADILSKSGMVILCIRYHTPFGELDIVARDKEYLVFIEVKARHNMKQQDIVPRSKIIKLCKAVDFYMSKHDLKQDTAIRFDYIAVEGNKIITHIQNAWDYCTGSW